MSNTGPKQKVVKLGPQEISVTCSDLKSNIKLHEVPFTS